MRVGNSSKGQQATGEETDNVEGAYSRWRALSSLNQIVQVVPKQCNSATACMLGCGLVRENMHPCGMHHLRHAVILHVPL